MREAVQCDYRGIFYIDFYKCVVQAEKLEDCTPLLNKLKILIHSKLRYFLALFDSCISSSLTLLKVGMCLRLVDNCSCGEISIE